MKSARTDRNLTAYRIGDPDGAWQIYSAEGARLYPGRWNTPTSPPIYASEHYSTALLEKLVHANGLMPGNQHFIRITIPLGTSYTIFQVESHPGWDGPDEAICKAFGQEWFLERTTALLLVPSIPARMERNILINPAHPDSAAITHELAEPVWWDARLYG